MAHDGTSHGSDPGQDQAPHAPSVAEIVRALAADVAALEAIAVAVVGRSRARLVDWSVEPLAVGAAGNPTSGGLFRVSGHVEGGHGDVVGSDGEPPVPWSAVLKVVRSPVETGRAWDRPTDAIYWRREADVLTSHLLDGVAGLALPRSFGVVEPAPATVWMWFEDLGRIDRAAWTEAEYQVAARAIARFHAPYLTGTAIPDLPWLNRDFLRGFHAVGRPSFERLVTGSRSGSDTYRGLTPQRAGPAMAAVERVMVDADRLLAALDAVPQTLCHHDANVDNLLVRPGPDGAPQLVAFDWQMVGPGPIGSDLGQLLCTLPATYGATSADVIEAAVLRTYRDELVAAGVDIDVDTVRVAYVADAALRQTSWAFLLLDLSVLAAEAAGDDAAVVDLIARFVETTAASRLPVLARQAAGLVLTP